MPTGISASSWESRSVVLRSAKNGEPAHQALTSGLSLALLHQAAVVAGLLHYGSQMNANFHMAAYAFAASFVVGILTSKPVDAEKGSLDAKLVYNHEDTSLHASLNGWLLALLLLGTCACLNWLWH